MNAPGLEGSQLQRKSADRRIFPLMGRCAGNAWTLSLESLKRPNSGLLNNGEKVRIPIGDTAVSFEPCPPILRLPWRLRTAFSRQCRPNGVSTSGLSRDGQRADPVGAARMRVSSPLVSLEVPVI
jgi:hypothetical protein